MGVYPDQVSVYPGDTLNLHVSFPSSAFRVDFYRHDADLEFQFSESESGASDLPDPPAPTDATDVVTYGDFEWPAFEFQIPSDARPGVWLASLMAPDQPPAPTLYSATDQALFVVKNPSPGYGASILYKLPLLTYHAYNNEGGISLYADGAGDTNLRIGTTLHRPGGGTGAVPWDGTVDSNDPSSWLQTYAHWDSWFVSWLARTQTAVDFCTDLDIHADDASVLLRSYNLMLSVGHDEYWSAAMRDNVEGFIDDGGNVAFFSGNTCFRQIVFDDPFTIRRAGWWVDAGRPENSLTGVSFLNGAYGTPDRPSIGYTVQYHDHWVYDGTGLQDGDAFGAENKLIGYECDGAMFDRSDRPPFTPTHDDGTPDSFIILGVADVSAFGGDQTGNLAARWACTRAEAPCSRARPWTGRESSERTWIPRSSRSPATSSTGCPGSTASRVGCCSIETPPRAAPVM
jgi:hypothetical protein